MPKVTLTGQGGQRAINIGHLPEVPSVVEPEFDNKTHHRKASFAAMNALEYQLRDARVPVGHAWHFVKSWYGVQSRSEFTTEQWCIISARLNACRRDAGLLRHFVEQIREFHTPVEPVEPAEVAGQRPPCAATSAITPTEPIQGLGWHCRTDWTGMFFDDRRYGNKKRRRHVVAWLNHRNGVFSLNIVSTELTLDGSPLPENANLQTVVDFIYKHARWQ